MAGRPGHVAVASRRRRCALAVVLPAAGALVLAVPVELRADAQEQGSFWRDLRQSLRLDVELVGFGTRRGLPVGGPYRPTLAFLGTPQDRLDLHARPRIRAAYSGLSVSLAPRWIGSVAYPDGFGAGSGRADGELFLTEGGVQLRIGRPLLVSVGRELLQWGPSLFLSPSNPFFWDNGRSQPHLELGGADFARVAWYASGGTSVSAISNLRRGRDATRHGEFRRIHSLKLDTTRTSFSGGAVVWKEEGGAEGAGGHGQWAASDALVVYGELGVERGRQPLYPRTSEGPLGWSLEPGVADADELALTGLAGATFTFVDGTQVALEYAYHSLGYGAGPDALQRTMAADLGRLAGQGGPLSAAAVGLQARSARPGLRLLSRHYVFAQAFRRGLAGVVHGTLRYTYNVTQGSGLAVSLLEWELGARTRLFATGSMSHGGDRSELGRFLRYELAVGARLVVR